MIVSSGLTDVASQMRVAFSDMAPNTGSNVPGDALMIPRILVVAASCSKASSRSRLTRATSVS